MDNLPIPPEQNLQQPVAPPPPKINSLFIIGGLILIAIILTGGIFIGKYLNSSQKIPEKEIVPTPTLYPSPTVTSIPDPTANWKTYTNNDLTFKYPSDWISNGIEVTSKSPKIRLVSVPKDSTLMNECMQVVSTEKIRGFTVKKFSRITTGEMCSTTDSNPREIWVVPSANAYAPGISYQYSISEAIIAEQIFDQILSTFKFTDQTTNISDWKTYENKELYFSFKYPTTPQYYVNEYRDGNLITVNLNLLRDDMMFALIMVKQDQCSNNSISVEDGQQLFKLMSKIDSLKIKTKSGTCMNIYKLKQEPLGMQKNDFDIQNKILSTFKLTN